MLSQKLDHTSKTLTQSQGWQRKFCIDVPEPVFCCDVHPRDPTLVVTGGEDDRAFVWNAASAEVVMKCDQGFKDSVVHSAFSHDGAFLAAADMSGVVKVWKMASKDIIWEFETSDITVRREWQLEGHISFVIVDLSCVVSG